MKIKLLITTLAMVLTAATVAVIPHARAATAGDDVFMDDGEGDFDSVPVPSSAPKKDKAAPTHQAEAAPAPPPSSAVGDEAAAVMGGDTTPPAAPEHVATPEENAPVVEDTTPVAPVAAPAHKAAKAAHQAAHKKTSAPAKVAGGGKFLMTKDSCEMHREPASESEKMITVKASRKIWTEAVDENWVKAYDKTGAPGFISKDCF